MDVEISCDIEIFKHFHYDEGFNEYMCTALVKTLEKWGMLDRSSG